VRVLGVDPGSAVTGWALLSAAGGRVGLVEGGTIRCRGDDRPQRLADLHARLGELVTRLEPDCAAVEMSYSGRNPRSGLALAESRGVALAVLGAACVPVHGYTPASIKQSVVGSGRAEKQQVVFMVTRLLRLTESPPQDAADAMAAALTHLHSSRWRSLAER
jgi:crossover junction endodeoxyribonuclease RuvC